MNNTTLTIGAKVRIKGKDDYGVGTLEHIGDTNIFGRQTCIVRFPDRAVKVIADEIERVIETIPDSDTITISREEFDKAVHKVLDPKEYENDLEDFRSIMALCLPGTVICSKLRRELFGDKG